jgi:hypothetical protein
MHQIGLRVQANRSMKGESQALHKGPIQVIPFSFSSPHLCLLMRLCIACAAERLQITPDTAEGISRSLLVEELQPRPRDPRFLQLGTQ